MYIQYKHLMRQSTNKIAPKHERFFLTLCLNKLKV